jgi:hypothetical protein
MRDHGATVRATIKQRVAHLTSEIDNRGVATLVERLAFRPSVGLPKREGRPKSELVYLRLSVKSVYP